MNNVEITFNGTREELEALETVFGPQPLVFQVHQPNGSTRLAGRVRLWTFEEVERASLECPGTDLERLEAIAARFYDEGEVVLARRCRGAGLDVGKALAIYRMLADMSDEEVKAWARQQQRKADQGE